MAVVRSRGWILMGMLPNGSRLSCGANAGWRKHPASRYELAGGQTYASVRAGPGSFKRLLGGTALVESRKEPMRLNLPRLSHAVTKYVTQRWRVVGRIDVTRVVTEDAAVREEQHDEATVLAFYQDVASPG